MRARAVVFAALFFIGSSRLLASGTIQLYSPAGISFPSLSVPLGIRAVAMGDAYTAAGDDADAVNWNPAGLAMMSGYQLGLADNEWDPALGIRQEYLVYGQRITKGSGIAASANYFNIGELDERDVNGGLLGQSSASLISGNLGYGFSLLSENVLHLGLSLEYAAQDLFGTESSDFGGNFGAVYEWMPELQTGLSINHLGSGDAGYSPPESVSIGAASHIFERKLLLSLDGEFPFQSEALINGGAELLLDQLSLRAGYRYAVDPNPGDVQTGFTAGAGFRVGLIRIDYAYVPYGQLSGVNRVQLTMDLPSDFFQPKFIGAVATTTTAKSFFDQGKDDESKGDELEALIQYQRCVESYPKDQMGGTVQEFYVVAKQKSEDLQSDLNKHGDNGQVTAVTKKYLSDAAADMAAGKDKEALEALKQAQEINPPGSPAAEVIGKQIKLASSQLEGRLSGYRDAARIADSANRLTIAIDNYARIRAIDPNDKEANSFFETRASDIRQLLQLVHRKGIDQYVAGNIQGAIQIWKLGQKLDINGDINFERDIDKAEKLINIQQQTEQK